MQVARSVTGSPLPPGALPQNRLIQRVGAVSFSTAHPECERSERIEGAVSVEPYAPDRPPIRSLRSHSG